MAGERENPFDSLEDAHQYLSLLGEALEEAHGGLQQDIAVARAGDAARRLEALQLVNYKLDRLRHHVGSSRRIINDLRTLRRLLLGEREELGEAAPGVAPAEALAR